MSRGPAPGVVYVPTRACPVCGDAFYTRVGLDEHVRLGQHNQTTRRWITGKVSPAGLANLQDWGRQIAALNNSRRRRCNDCGHESTPAGVGLHQMHTGHTGWTEAA